MTEQERAQYDHEQRSRNGKLGGQKRLDNLRDAGIDPSTHFSNIGARGGKATNAKLGKEHYQRIGQIGGRISKRKPVE